MYKLLFFLLSSISKFKLLILSKTFYISQNTRYFKLQRKITTNTKLQKKLIFIKHYMFKDILYNSDTTYYNTNILITLVQPVYNLSLVPHNQNGFYCMHSANRCRYLTIHKIHCDTGVLINTHFFSNINIFRLNINCYYISPISHLYTFYHGSCHNTRVLYPIYTCVKRRQLIVLIFTNFYNG